MKRLDGRCIMIVGSGAGIGAATARRLAAEGAKVALSEVNIQHAEAIAEEIKAAGGKAEAYGCDVTSEESIASFFDKAVSDFGGLDGIHINAADTAIAVRDTNVTTVPMDVFDQTIAVNLRGHFLCTRYAIPLLLERGAGSIVYTSSRGALAADVARVSYAVSKSGLHALMRHVALTWGRSGIRANVVAPGLILTQALRDAVSPEFIEERIRITPNKRLGEPDDVAGSVAFLMSDDADYVNGQILSVDGGTTMR